MEPLFSPFIYFNVLFGAILVAATRLLLGRRGSPILWAYVLVTLVFVYLLPEQEYSSEVGADVLLLSHLLMFAFLLSVLLLTRGYASSASLLCARALAVPWSAIFFAVGAWVGLRAYLVVAYGPAALAFSRAQLVHSFGMIEFSTWEVALSSITTTMLLGALVVVVIVWAAGGFKRSLFVSVLAVAMLVVIIVTNESPIGSRRLLLVLFSLWFVLVWQRTGLPLRTFARRRAHWIVTAAAGVIGLSIYYQYIRNNDFTDILMARDPVDVVMAVAKFSTTFESAETKNDVQYLRSGPFDFFTRVVAASTQDDRSSKGEATLFSLAIAVPKPLYPGEKPVGDIDEVLLDHLNIVPSKPFLSIDYPTSLPSIAVADFGPLGVLIAGALLGLCFITLGILLRHVARVPLVTLLIFGLSIQLIGSQEASLTAIVAALRDTALAVSILLPSHWLIRRIRRALRPPARLAPRGAVLSNGYTNSLLR